MSVMPLSIPVVEAFVAAYFAAKHHRCYGEDYPLIEAAVRTVVTAHQRTWNLTYPRDLMRDDQLPLCNVVKITRRARQIQQASERGSASAASAALWAELYTLAQSVEGNADRPVPVALGTETVAQMARRICDAASAEMALYLGKRKGWAAVGPTLATVFEGSRV